MSDQPYATARMVPVDAMIAAARYVSREFGDYGYRIGVEGGVNNIPAPVEGTLPYLFAVRHSDGSEFYLAADRWGNVALLDWDGVAFVARDSSDAAA